MSEEKKETKPLNAREVTALREEYARLMTRFHVVSMASSEAIDAETKLILCQEISARLLEIENVFFSMNLEISYSRMSRLTRLEYNPHFNQ